jgi:hypothetical protein
MAAHEKPLWVHCGERCLLPVVRSARRRVRLLLGSPSAAGAGTDMGLWLLDQLIVPGRFLMRVLAMALVTIAAALAISPAQAQTYDPRYPVCLQIYQGYTDYYFECGYTSLAQCNMSASGRAAQCVVNPYYAGGKARRDRRQRRPN